MIFFSIFLLQVSFFDSQQIYPSLPPGENPRDSVLFHLDATLAIPRRFYARDAVDEDATSISKRDGVLREKRTEFSRYGPFFLWENARITARKKYKLS